MRILHDDESLNPIVSAINLVDVFLVIIAALLISIAQNPHWHQQTVRDFVITTHLKSMTLLFVAVLIDWTCWLIVDDETSRADWSGNFRSSIVRIIGVGWWPEKGCYEYVCQRITSRKYIDHILDESAINRHTAVKRHPYVIGSSPRFMGRYAYLSL